MKFFRKEKTAIKSREIFKARLITFYYIKSYGFFGRRTKVLEKIRKRFRRKYLYRKGPRKNKDVEELLRIKSRFQRNFGLAVAWGETNKIFSPSDKFNSFIGWSKSKCFRLADKFGEVV